MSNPIQPSQSVVTIADRTPQCVDFEEGEIEEIDFAEEQVGAVVKEAIAQKNPALVPLIKVKFVELQLSPDKVDRFSRILVNAGLISDFESQLMYVQTLYQARHQKNWKELRLACLSLPLKIKKRLFAHAIQQWNEGRCDRQYLRFLIQLEFPVNVNKLNETTAKVLLNLGLAPEDLLCGTWATYNFGIIELAFRRGAPIQLAGNDLCSAYFEWKKEAVGMQNLSYTPRNFLEFLKRVMDYDFNRCQTTKRQSVEPLMVQAISQDDEETFYYLADQPSVDIEKPVPISASLCRLYLTVKNPSSLLKIAKALHYLAVEKRTNLRLGSPLLTAIDAGCIPLVKSLLEWKADVNVTIDPNKTGCWHLVFGRMQTAPGKVEYCHSLGVRVALTQLLIPYQPAPVEFAQATFTTEEDVLFLIQSGIRIDQQDASGRTLLHVACFRGWIRCVDALLGREAQVNTVDNQGGSPIGAAFWFGTGHIFLSLLNRGANDVNSVARIQNITLIKWLLANRNYGLFADALRKGAFFGHLIFPHADPDLKNYLTQNITWIAPQIPQEGRADYVDSLCTPQGRIPLLNVLKSLGGQTSAKNKEGANLTAFAIAAEDFPFVRHLIDVEKIDVNELSWKGLTPLSALCGTIVSQEKMSELLGLIALLLQRGAKINQPCLQGGTALTMAVTKFRGDFRYLELLFKHDPDIARKEHGTQVLQFVNRDHAQAERLFLFLLQRGADPYAYDSNQVRPIQTIVQKNFKEAAKYILRYFPSLHAQIDSSRTLDEFCRSLPSLLQSCPEVQSGGNPLEVLYLMGQSIAIQCARMTRQACRQHVLDLLKKFGPQEPKAQRLFLMELLYEINYTTKGKKMVDVPKAEQVDLDLLIHHFDEIIFDEEKIAGHSNPRRLRDDKAPHPVLLSSKTLREQLKKRLDAVRAGASSKGDVPQVLHKYYLGLEDVLMHLTHYLLTIDDVDMRNSFLINLAISASLSDFRWLRNVYRQYEVLVLRVEPRTFEDDLHEVLKGGTPSIPMSSLLVRLEKAMDQCLKEFCQAEKAYLMRWFGNHVPERWNAEEHQSLLQKVQELEKRGENRDHIALFLYNHGILLNKIETPIEAIQKASELAGQVIRQKYREFQRDNQEEREALQKSLKMYDGYMHAVMAMMEANPQTQQPALSTHERIVEYLSQRGIYLEPVQSYKEAIRVHRSQKYLMEELWDKQANEIKVEARIQLLETLGVIREAAHSGLFSELCQPPKPDTQPQAQARKRKAEK